MGIWVQCDRPGCDEKVEADVGDMVQHSKDTEMTLWLPDGWQFHTLVAQGTARDVLLCPGHAVHWQTATLGVA